ncbi:hypothetical protein [Nocardia asteroides]|uniref:hypothetical protein n=1 Tax=Nocardia asteroides TaxID=1824 RepID=UPI001E64A5C8|nr:hypothetical protein [Nocardia asteroides]UGT61367.1 hypothetical protein LTT61_30285 [Nocardia asteroides]
MDEAVRGARLVAADIEQSTGFPTEVGSTYDAEWRRFGKQTGRPEPEGWVNITVREVGTSAALDPTEPGSATAAEFAMELVRILQDDIQIHLREPWPRDPAGGGRALEPTDAGWRSRVDGGYLVPYGQLGRFSSR